MNNRLKHYAIALCSCIALSGTSTAYAGDQHNHRHGHGYKMERIFKKLDLTDAQESQIKQIMESVRTEKQNNNWRNSFREIMMLNPNDAEYTAKTEALATQASERLKAHMQKFANARMDIYGLLNSEQQAEMEKLIQERIERRGERGGKQRWQ